MNSFAFLNGCRVVAVACLQFGDTGKGKIVDWLSAWADVIVRATGGANAGHTIVVNDRRVILHLVPSGILHDVDGKVNVIGRGVALCPATLVSEIAQLRTLGIECRNLRISHRAKLVLPQHILLDRLRELAAGAGKLGTTGRGIGPAYVDHVGRYGLTVNDLLNPNSFRAKLERDLDEKVRLLATFDPDVVRSIVPDRYYDERTILSADAIVKAYVELGRYLRPMVCDTDALVQHSSQTRRILLEGAQGHLLSIEDGTYPYVTSSDCTEHGMARGSGLRERDIDLVLGLIKGFYMTRVGSGPFPTELGGEHAAHWRASGASEQHERATYPNASINSQDEFEQGIAIRWAGGEYGATTGRPRGIGWLDLPLLRYALRYPARTELVLTKLDVLNGIQQLKVCTGYEYVGLPYTLGATTLERGTYFSHADPDAYVLDHCRPVYETLPGWTSLPTSGHSEDLPGALIKALRFIRDYVGVTPRILSVGPDRSQTIVIPRD